jgi:ribosomal protein S18 acetylase RimI-like enzyme
MLVIRPCSRADLDLVNARWSVPGDVHGAHYAAQTSNAATYLIAWEDAEPLGSDMVQWNGCSGPNARHTYPEAVEVNHLQVRREWRGRGVGTALINDSETRATDRGHRVVALGVGVENEGAARLYRRLGYKATGVFDTFSYSWIDEDGVCHPEIETSELLVKRL